MEEDPLSPVTDYGRAKAEAEVRVALAHADALLVRTSLLYGGDTPSKHELSAHDPEFTFFTNEIRSPVQVGDLAQALLELAELDVSGPLHVAGADDVSRAEFAELIARGPVRSAPAPDDQAARLCAGLRAGAGAPPHSPSRRTRSAPLGRFVLLEPLGDRLGTLRRALGERVDLGGGTLERLLDGAVHARLDPLRQPQSPKSSPGAGAGGGGGAAGTEVRSSSSAGSGGAAPSISSSKTRSGSSMSFSRRSPSGKIETPSGSDAPTSARVVSESRT